MNKIIIGLILNLLVSISVHAGTVGMAGLWAFEGQMITVDSSGLIIDTDPVIGEFNFNTGLVNLELDSPFFGLTWYATGTIDDRLDGTYWGGLEIFWSAASYNWNILWEITQQGSVASVITLDGDGDGIPGISITDGPYIGLSHAINGTLTAVPVPAAVWLFGSGLIGLIGVARRKNI